MLLSVFLVWKCFTDFSSLLQHPGVYLLALSLPCLLMFVVFGDGGTSFSSCFLCRCPFPKIHISCPEGLFCQRSHFYTPKNFLHASHFQKPRTVYSFAVLDTAYVITWRTTLMDALWFHEVFLFCLTTVLGFTCHHWMLLHADSFALPEHWACRSPLRSWDRGNLLLLPQSLQVSPPVWEDEVPCLSFF